VATGTPLNFDLSVIQGLGSSSKYNGNTVSDITSAYQTYQTGVPTGRGGVYAQSAMKKYGYASISDAAAGYLQAAGIPILSNAQISAAPNSGQTGDQSMVGQTGTTSTVTTPTPTTNDLNTLIANQFQTLSDAFAKAFGTAVYEPPLQSQYYSGTPADIQVPDQSSLAGYTSIPPGAQPTSSGPGLMTFVIIGALIFGAYYLYKRYKKS
jgi:hypothetical protein